MTIWSYFTCKPYMHRICLQQVFIPYATHYPRPLLHQSGRSPKVVAFLSATNFNSYIIELLQLHDAIQIEWNYAWIQCYIAIRSHLMIQKDVWNLFFATKFCSIFLLHGKYSLGKVINEVWYQACDLMRFIQPTHIYILHQTYECHFRTLQVNEW